MTPAVTRIRAMRIGSMSREMTDDEVRKKFLDSVRGIAKYWASESRAQTVQERCDGVAFSILVLLDGGHGMMPGFTVAASPHEDDREYRRELGEDWFPVSDCEHDIAGSLHEQYYGRRG